VFLFMKDGRFEVESNLPDDISMVNAGWNDITGVFYITVESKEFQEIELGDVLPDFPAPTIKELIDERAVIRA